MRAGQGVGKKECGVGGWGEVGRASVMRRRKEG